MRWTLKTIHSHFTLIGDRTIHYKYKYTVHKREIVLEILSNKGKDIRINWLIGAQQQQKPNNTEIIRIYACKISTHDKKICWTHSM